MNREELRLEAEEQEAQRREVEYRWRCMYVCQWCGSLDGMQDYYHWNVPDWRVVENHPTFYAHPEAPGDMIFAPCYECNRAKMIPRGYYPVSWPGVLEWARMSGEAPAAGAR